MFTEPITHATSSKDIDFATPIWRRFDYSKLLHHLSSELEDQLTSYPERDYLTLRTMIARRNGLDATNVLVAPGRTAIFYMIAQAFEGATATILTPSPYQYAEASERFDWKVTYADGQCYLSELDLTGQEFCWLCSPNIPDGKYRSKDEMDALIKANPDTTFIIDQTYHSFTSRPSYDLSAVKQYDNVVLIRSFSHSFGLPGLRIGYMAANVTFAKRLERYIEPWTINGLAVEAAKYLLIHPAQFTLPIRKWKRDCEELMAKLQLIEGLEVLPSDTTFFLMRLVNHKASELTAWLESEHNMTIANVSHTKGLEDGEYVRIIAREEMANIALLNAIKEFMSQSL